MKLSLIHNQYNRNPYAAESVAACLHALRSEGVDYEYIIFNDHGDESIKKDFERFLDDPRVQYVYSDVNWGQGVCTGGWVGAIPYLTGDFVHNMGADDIFTPLFYRIGLRELEQDPNLMLVHFNGISVNENLNPIGVMLDTKVSPDYYNKPFDCWKWWFGVEGNGGVTRANNNLLAPGVIYRRSLHDLIGPPDLSQFFGAADFEFWARVLFNGYKCKSFPLPCWLYRKTNFSTSVDTVDRTPDWVRKVKEKYTRLYAARKKE